MGRFTLPAFALLCCAVAPPAIGDAIVVTRAMRASTIAEVSVEEDVVSVRLEIGVRDFESFRNLMPDEIYVKLGHEPAPLVERLALFFREILICIEIISDFSWNPPGERALLVTPGPARRYLPAQRARTKAPVCS